MFLFDKKTKGSKSLADAKTKALIKDAVIVVGLVAALKAAAYLWLKD
jgi:hypothetical protein